MMKNKRLKAKISQYSLVKFDFFSKPIETHKNYPFVEGRAYVFLGEIPNMPGHCVVVDTKANQVYSCYHTNDFIELKEDEV